MSSEMVLRNGDMIHTVTDLMSISEMLIKSGMLPSAIKTKEAAAAIILKGREIGMPVMESFSLINVIQGKPTIAPQGMIALARRTRELEDLQISDDGDTCTVIVKRKGQSPFTTKFSMKDAARMSTSEGYGDNKKTVPLSEKYNWRAMPAVMRQWRAIAANFRITFPDVIGGMYTPEELGATVDEEGEVIEGTVIEHSNGHVTEPNTAPTTPHIPNLPAPVSIPSHQQGNGNGHAEQTPGVTIPPQLATLIKQYATRSYGTPEKAKAARGVAAGILDEYAGDTDRRRSFLMAIFGKDSSKDLTDGNVAAILAWKDAPNAKNEVNRVIAEWLKVQGQQELFAEGTPVTA